jgi:D-beta-D-heptose 7-phosphate kinase/D-beta-D-heptose 1-phosphate adenosyltransferase
VSGPLVIVGDCLLDRDIRGTASRLAPDGPAPVLTGVRESSRPGGAGLAATLAAADGCPVVLVTAISSDEAGSELRGLLARARVPVVDIGLEGPTPQKIRVLADGRLLARIDPGCEEGAGKPGKWSAQARAAVGQAGAVLVADYGRGLTADPKLRSDVVSATRRVPVVWDPHPRGSIPVEGVRLATPNAQEGEHFAPGAAEGDSLKAHSLRAAKLLHSWRAANVAITLSQRGALLAGGSAPPMLFPADPATGDACGAGDRFSSAAAIALLHGALPSQAVKAAVATARDYVASGGVSGLTLQAPDRSPQPGEDLTTALAVAERVRSRGGTVVMTGGCFDLLHPGHVATLEAARRLGDCLIVALNSDSSVTALKGPDRPVVPEHERATVLAALRCVDVVVVFDEATPERVLEELKPEVFAKGGDYALSDLPERAILDRWGGQVVILPYLENHSTSELIRRAVGSDA